MRIDREEKIITKTVTKTIRKTVSGSQIHPLGWKSIVLPSKVASR